MSPEDELHDTMNGSVRLSQQRPFNRGFLSAPVSGDRACRRLFSRWAASLTPMALCSVQAEAMRCVLDEKPPPRGKEGGAAFAAYLERLEQRRELTEDLAAYYQSGGYAMFDRHFLAWAAAEGFSFDLLVNDDLHHRPESLHPGYACAVFVGHDGESPSVHPPTSTKATAFVVAGSDWFAAAEYWSWEMRDAVDAYTAGGGMVARCTQPLARVFCR